MYCKLLLSQLVCVDCVTVSILTMSQGILKTYVPFSDIFCVGQVPILGIELYFLVSSFAFQNLKDLAVGYIALCYISLK